MEETNKKTSPSILENTNIIDDAKGVKEKENITVITVTAEEKSTIKDVTVSAPVFILFAEYMGFLSKLYDWIDEWVKKGKVLEHYKMKFLAVEATNLFEEMQHKYALSYIKSSYEKFYDAALKEIDEAIKKSLAV